MCIQSSSSGLTLRYELVPSRNCHLVLRQILAVHRCTHWQSWQTPRQAHILPSNYFQELWLTRTKSVISYTQLMFDFNVSWRIKTSSAFIRRATKDMPSFKFWLTNIAVRISQPHTYFGWNVEAQELSCPVFKIIKLFQVIITPIKYHDEKWHM